MAFEKSVANRQDFMPSARRYICTTSFPFYFAEIQVSYHTHRVIPSIIISALQEMHSSFRFSQRCMASNVVVTLAFGRLVIQPRRYHQQVQCGVVR